MASAKVELTGGGFQDSEGNVLALGYLTFRLNQDAEVNGLQICSGVEITVTLDGSGNAIAGQYLWGNDVLSPVNTYYTVTGYTAEGQPAWGPNNQQVVGTGTFDLGSWIPNQVFSWVPSLQSGISVEVSGTPLSSSSVADFVNSGTVTFTDMGGGQISATASVPPPVVTGVLQTPDVGKFCLWTVGMGGTTLVESLGTIGDKPTVSTSGSASDDGPFPPTAVEDAYSRLIVSGNSSTVVVYPNGCGYTGSPSFAKPGGWWMGRALTFMSKVRFEDSTSLLLERAWVGLTDGDPTAAVATSYSFANVLAFFNSSGGNWFAVAGGGTQTAVDTGVAPSTSSISLKIVYNPGVRAQYYINGLLKATITTNLPSSTSQAFPIVGLNGNGGATDSKLHLMNLYVQATPA